jgi:RHH-type transcriptional regulator, proline utilization regulon repressor / proline dehydrogenase / delta 1-pyrroline-5-carboxylate dehydrogenase
MLTSPKAERLLMTDLPSIVPLPDRQKLSLLYTAEETTLISSLANALPLTPDQNGKIETRAGKWVTSVRAATTRVGMVDAFLQEYGLSTDEGIILMRLSEALIRTPDFATAQELMRDKLVAGDWDDHSGASPTGIVNAATAGLRLSSAWISATGGGSAAKLAAKLGDRVLHAGVVRGMGIMARHFVLGSTIEDAVARASKSGKKGELCSFDMLGEGAITQGDADRYFDAYKNAITFLAGHVGKGASVATVHGLSVKLSALHPRYEYAKRATCVPILIEKVRTLALIAKSAGVGLSLDAEEADRLEISLHIFLALLNDPELADWDGLGIVIQAYQRRATATIDTVLDAAKRAGRAIAVRLVKGAYWDGEIKRAQEMGLESYPVFTRKEHTDISYLACAAKLLAAGRDVFPQFATHNAHTAAAILEMAGDNTAFEFQRLHGMGEALHDEVCAATGVKSRVYAPVGSHKELLPYLVRRLLENGANSSFVNQLMNPDIEIDDIVANPVQAAKDHAFTPHRAIKAPRDMFGGERLAAFGMDLTQSSVAETVREQVPQTSKANGASVVTITNPANHAEIVGQATLSTAHDIDVAVAAASASAWSVDFDASQRAAILNKAALVLEERMPDLMALCVVEAGKTFPDALAEIREAVDFCRYYAVQAVAPAMQSREPLGVVACISPWNFPLAIFMGQVCAALVAGNTVVAKPAGQTPLVAQVAVSILKEAGVLGDALHLVIGEGDIGAALVGHKGVDGVCFTGSTATALAIAKTRAAIGRADSVLIAETGGINAMIVDSTALLEQAVGDVVASAFQSAGQRCSACRVVCIQDDVADDFERLLAGAIGQLKMGDPGDLATDVGPIIDAPARDRIADYIASARDKSSVIGEVIGGPDLDNGHFIAPIAFRVGALSEIKAEVFGPVLYVVRFAANDALAIVDQINALGFGLTLGVHSRIDARIKAIAQRAKVGNIYVNRNQIGAVVGVQPFGGEGLSGTGPKAGGLHYLLRMSRGGGELTTLLTTDPKQADHPRVGVINQLAAELGDDAFINQGLAASLASLACKSALSGPTGEDNSLTLVPRGVIFCAGGVDESDIVRQILLVLSAGCSVIVARTALNDAQLTAIKSATLPQGSVSFIKSVDINSTLVGDIDGVIADGSNREALAAALAQRDGAIIPLLSSNGDFWRLFHERTLTIDTTAAGGNASLLAMQSDA